MLNGIGGCTVAQAKSTLSYPEFLSWIRYRNKWGSLHVGMRLDRSVGRSSAFFGNMLSKGKSLKPDDFSPYDAAQEDDEDVSFEEAFAMLKAVSTKDSR